MLRAAFGRCSGSIGLAFGHASDMLRAALGLGLAFGTFRRIGQRFLNSIGLHSGAPGAGFGASDAGLRAAFEHHGTNLSVMPLEDACNPLGKASRPLGNAC